MKTGLLSVARVPLEGDLRILTSLRFLAAFWVVVFHFRTRISYPDNYVWDIVDNGARGVDFFFILSGFVLYHVYGDAIRNNAFKLPRYLQKRFSRIYPLHFATMIAMFALAIARNGAGDLGKLFGDLFSSTFLLHSWGVTGGLVLNGQSWTISSEFFAYILFGLAAIYARRAFSSVWVILLAFVVSFVAIHYFALAIGKTSFMHMTWDFGALRIVPLFLLGMLLRWATSYVQPAQAVVLGALGVVSFLIIADDPEVTYPLILPFSLLIVSGARLSGLKWAPLNQTPFVYLGEISYSTYLVHSFTMFFYFDVFPKLAPDFLSWMDLNVHLVVFTLFTIAASALSYHLIEHPARSYLNGFGGRRWGARKAPAAGI
jgi:peptidoglycan/LPS O-acetylase OafA/YrhL